MSDSVLDALIKAGVSGDIIEQYVNTKRKSLKHATQSQQPAPVSDTSSLPKPPRPKRKCTEKQLAALAAGRAKNPNMIAKMKRLEEAKKQAEAAAAAKDDTGVASNGGTVKDDTPKDDKAEAPKDDTA